MTQPTDFTAHLDTSLRPQDDLYGYVNHKWMESNPIPDSETRWGVFNILRDEALHDMQSIYEGLSAQDDFAVGSIEQQARDFYYTGMHVDMFEVEHLNLLKAYSEKIDSINSSSQLASVIGELDRIDVQGVWSSTIDVDNDDSTRHLFHVSQPDLTLPNRDYYLEDNEKMQGIRKEYEKHVHLLHTHFPSLAESPDKLWDVVWSLELSMAEASRSSSELRDVKENYNRRSFSFLPETYSSIDWVTYADAFGWANPGDVSVDQPEYFAFLQKQMKDRPLEDWKTYMKWRLVISFYGSISESYAELRFQFFGRILSGTKEMVPLWKRVTASIDGAIGEGVGQLYAEKHFPETSKKQVLKIVEDVRAVYAHRITTLAWMSDPTKKEALKKLKNIKVLIGYPDTFRSFSAIKIGRTSYLENKIAAREFDTDYHLRKLNEPTSRDVWHMYPQTVNAYNDPQRLVICFPAAILQKPFFDPNAHLAANMAGIGMVIGHELTHSFDDQGCQFDSEGNSRTWQTDEERAAFDERAAVIIKQADNFEVLPGVKMQGKLVIGESIADLGGLEMSYQVLNNALGGDTSVIATEGLTAAELFFLNYSASWCENARDEFAREMALNDPHPSDLFRVNGMVMHVQAFYDTFHVVKGDLLYLAPDDRAYIW